MRTLTCLNDVKFDLTTRYRKYNKNIWNLFSLNSMVYMGELKVKKNQLYAFSDFVVDPDANTLLKQQQEKRLEPQIIRLLCFFAENSRQVVSRDEIFKAVWPGVIVGNEAVTRAIFALRLALGDDAKNPRYIETVSKKGYRFMVEVKSLNQKEIQIQDDNQGLNKGGLAAHKIRYWAMSAILVVAVFVGVNYLPINDFDSLSWEISEIKPLTQSLAEEQNIRLNPENGALSYVLIKDWQSNISRLNVDADFEEQLTNDNWHKQDPQWVDRTTLLFIRCREQVCQIVRQSEDQIATVLFETDQIIDNLYYDYFGLPQVLFTLPLSHTKNELWQLSLLSKNDAVPSDDEALSHEKALNLSNRYSVLPDKIEQPKMNNAGSRLYYVENNGYSHKLMVLDMQSQKVKTVITGFTQISDYELAQGEETFLISGSFQQKHAVWKYSVNSKSTKLVHLAGVGEKILGIEYDPKSHALIYEKSMHSDDLTLQSFSSDKELQSWGMNSNANELHGVTNKTGDKLYFSSNSSGSYELWENDIKNKSNLRLTQIEADFLGRAIISNDGRYAAISFSKHGNEIGIVNLEKRSLIHRTKVDRLKHLLSWSLDGNKIYVSDHLDFVRLFEYDIPSFQETKLFDNAGLVAQEVNIDGNTHLFFADFTRSALMSLDLTSAKSKDGSLKQLMAINNIQDYMPGQYVVDDSAAYYIEKSGLKRNLIRQDFDSESQLIRVIGNWTWVSDINARSEKVVLHRGSRPSRDIIKLQFRRN